MGLPPAADVASMDERALVGLLYDLGADMSECFDEASLRACAERALEDRRRSELDQQFSDLRARAMVAAARSATTQLSAGDVRNALLVIEAGLPEVEEDASPQLPFICAEGSDPFMMSLEECGLFRCLAAYPNWWTVGMHGPDAEQYLGDLEGKGDDDTIELYPGGIELQPFPSADDDDSEFYVAGTSEKRLGRVMDAVRQHPGFEEATPFRVSGQQLLKAVEVGAGQNGSLGYISIDPGMNQIVDWTTGNVESNAYIRTTAQNQMASMVRWGNIVSLETAVRMVNWAFVELPTNAGMVHAHRADEIAKACELLVRTTARWQILVDTAKPDNIWTHTGNAAVVGQQTAIAVFTAPDLAYGYRQTTSLDAFDFATFNMSLEKALGMEGPGFWVNPGHESVVGSCFLARPVLERAVEVADMLEKGRQEHEAAQAAEMAAAAGASE